MKLKLRILLCSRLAVAFGSVMVPVLLLHADDSTPAAPPGNTATTDSTTASAPQTGSQIQLPPFSVQGLVAGDAGSIAGLKAFLQAILRADPDLAGILSRNALFRQAADASSLFGPDVVTKGADAGAAVPSDTGNAKTIAREQLAEAEAMADAALAPRSTSGGAGATTTPSGTTVTSSTATITHYTTSDLSTAPALGPDSSDAHHHSMEDLIDGH